ncbi:MAG TPA: 50S ribosomal protein L4 [Patescibacteria group bacterium]|nr:50S ribosomal protein L4 [Patescibacteria group bacterium]
MNLKTVTLAGKTGETTTEMFGGKITPALVAQAVRVFLSNQRAGTAKVKSRGEVDLTKKKWYKQKHTGNARHGAKSAPIFVGGGVTHGPRGITNWKLVMPTKMRKAALASAYAMQAKDGKILVVEGLEKLTGKTKEMLPILEAAGVTGKATLIVVAKMSENLKRATRNLPKVVCVPADSVTAYYVARAQRILIDSALVEAKPVEKKTAAKKTVTKKVTAK